MIKQRLYKWLRQWAQGAFLGSVVLVAHADPMPANEVFVPSVSITGAKQLTLTWHIESGAFLYQKSIKVVPPKAMRVAPITFPSPQFKTDASGQETPIYRHELTLTVLLDPLHAGKTAALVQYQGCSDDGFCYPPIKQTMQVTIDDHLNIIQASLPNTPPILFKVRPAATHPLFEGHSRVISLLIFFGLGMLLAFTPCVLPMLPILSRYLVSNAHSPRRARWLSISYVMGMALGYALLGATIGFLSKNLSIYLQSPWVLIPFVCILVWFALSMMGIVSLRQANWQAALSHTKRRQFSAHYAGALLLGAFSILVVSPCVTPALVGALTYIADSKNVFFGAATLFCLGLGMGTPLLIITTSAAHFLPKAGAWMEKINIFFGILLLGLAIFLASRLLTPHVMMFAWSGFLLLIGIYLGAFLQAKTPAQMCQQALGLLCVGYAGLLLIGGGLGNHNPLAPLVSLTTVAPVSTPASTAQSIQGLPALEAALTKAHGHPVIVDVTADWCLSCQLIDAHVLHDPSVISAMLRFVVVKVDLTTPNTANDAILKKYGITGPPTFLFFRPDGTEARDQRLVGEMTPSVFLAHLASI